MIRINKYLSECGISSRRNADSLILEGRVAVNGKIILELGQKIDPGKDKVSVDGELLRSEARVYYLLNKPKGTITSTNDEKDRITVIDLIKTAERIFPVGRLDYNTTGVLILTNDGEFTNFLTHPNNGIPREYEAKLDKALTKEDREKLQSGIYIDKRKSKFTNISFPLGDNYNIVKVVTVEGRNHFVKNMFKALNYQVKSLHRTKFGNFTTGKLRPGEYIKLDNSEIQLCYNSFSGKIKKK